LFTFFYIVFSFFFFHSSNFPYLLLHLLLLIAFCIVILFFFPFIFGFFFPLIFFLLPSFKLFVLFFANLTHTHFCAPASPTSSSVRIAAGYGLECQGSIPSKSRRRSLLPVVDRSEAHPASYPLCTGSSFPEGNVAGTWSWTRISI
jgi:hypothetical protein